MSRWTPIAPWRPIAGTGVAKALTSGADADTGLTIPGGCHAVQLSAVGGNCCVTISAAGTAASATGDALIKVTDGPLVLGCEPGDHVHAWGLATGVTLFALPVTH